MKNTKWGKKNREVWNKRGIVLCDQESSVDVTFKLRSESLEEASHAKI